MQELSESMASSGKINVFIVQACFVCFLIIVQLSPNLKHRSVVPGKKYSIMMPINNIYLTYRQLQLTY
jgi:hypothetical protein